MKTLTPFLYLLVISLKVFSQVWTPPGAGLTGSIYRSGNVGIGMTSVPSYNLVVIHPTLVYGAKILFGGTSPILTTPSASSALEIQNNNDGSGAYFTLFTGGTDKVGLTLSSTVSYGLAITSETRGSATPQNIGFNVGGSQRLLIKTNGQIVIGSPSSTPSPYKLFVTGGILTEKLKVAISGTADWSDYVFADDYKLMPLQLLELYIKENNHLPQIPSAEEMVTNGNDVAETDAMLLAKIEELTLYIIEQQKQIVVLQDQIISLQKK